MTPPKTYKGLPPSVYQALSLTTAKAVGPLGKSILKEGDSLMAVDRELTYCHRGGEVAKMPDGLYKLVGQSLVFEAAATAPPISLTKYQSAKPMQTTKLPAHTFKRVLPLVEKDDLRPAFTGVLVVLKKDKNELQAVGTDGHAVGVSRVKVGNAPTDGQCIIPPKVARLHGLLGAGTLFFQVRNPITARIEYETDTVYFKPIDERYPDYENAIPVDFPLRHVLDANGLIGAIARLPKPHKGFKWVIRCQADHWQAYLAELEGYGQHFTPVKNQVPVSMMTTRPQTGTFENTKPEGVLLMPLFFEDLRGSGEIAFDAALLLKCLKSLGAAQWINLDMSAYNRPAFLTVAGGEQTPPKSVSVRAKAPAPDPSLLLRARALALTLLLELELARYSR